MSSATLPSLTYLTRVFGRIGVLSFGGPAAQIALMHRELVEARPWLSEKQFLTGLSFCMLLPGPEAMQLATYAGWRLRGVTGGLIAGGLFVLPGALVIAALVALYVSLGTQDWVQAAFLGIKATVIAIVAQAVLRLSRKALNSGWQRVLAVAAFLALFLFGVPFPIVLLVAALVGAWLAQPSIEAIDKQPLQLGSSFKTIGIWVPLWLAPLPLLWAADAQILFDLAAFFAWLAVITFGGAYALLSYMAQVVVDTHGWITGPEMIDALGLAETTPGPLILVTQFVAMLTGHHAGGWIMAFLAGILSLWMTFIPCFLWIFLGAPHLDRLMNRPRLAAALTGITAAVTGVIANLSLWFAAQVLFTRQIKVDQGPLQMTLPDPASLNTTALGLLALACATLLWRGWALGWVLILTAGTGLAIHLAF